MKFIELALGETATSIYWADKDRWETFDFLKNKWVSMEKSDYAVFMHEDYRWPSIMTFNETLKDLINVFPGQEKITIVYYNNHSFGALICRN